MENLSKKERHELHLQKQREHAEAVRKRVDDDILKAQQSKRKRTKLYFISTIIGVIVIFSGLGYGIYASKFKYGIYDNLAKCLTEKGAIMYGAIDWCSYTKEQAAMFGNSFKYINYKDYREGQDIKLTPTWVINGQKYERVQSFDRLAQLSGCSITSF